MIHDTLHAHVPSPIAVRHAHVDMWSICLQELLSERARLQSEVDALRAATAAEASSSKQELATQRATLEQQHAAVSARIEAVTEGRGDMLLFAQRELLARHVNLLVLHKAGWEVRR
jgi:outer membrane murein-binding lipoprotein Lpp